MNHFIPSLDDVYQQLETMTVSVDSAHVLGQLLEESANLISKTCTRNHYSLKALQITWKKRLDAAVADVNHPTAQLQELDSVRIGIMNEIYSLLFFGV
jgi:flagellar hook-associated protein FlgK